MSSQYRLRLPPQPTKFSKPPTPRGLPKRVSPKLYSLHIEDPKGTEARWPGPQSGSCQNRTSVIQLHSCLSNSHERKSRSQDPPVERHIIRLEEVKHKVQVTTRIRVNAAKAYPDGIWQNSVTTADSGSVTQRHKTSDEKPALRNSQSHDDIGVQREGEGRSEDDSQKLAKPHRPSEPKPPSAAYRRPAAKRGMSKHQTPEKEETKDDSAKQIESVRIYNQ